MNTLLDTHAFLWALGRPGELSSKARQAIEAPRNTVFVSAISAVEITIKRAFGKLEAPDKLYQELTYRGFQHLPLKFEHGERLAALPEHHKDPFDRLLISQALVENLTIISRDEKMRLYPVSILW